MSSDPTASSPATPARPPVDEAGAALGALEDTPPPGDPDSRASAEATGAPPQSSAVPIPLTSGPDREDDSVAAPASDSLSSDSLSSNSGSLESTDPAETLRADVTGGVAEPAHSAEATAAEATAPAPEALPVPAQMAARQTIPLYAEQPEQPSPHTAGGDAIAYESPDIGASAAPLEAEPAAPEWAEQPTYAEPPPWSAQPTSADPAYTPLPQWQGAQPPVMEPYDTSASSEYIPEYAPQDYAPQDYAPEHRHSVTYPQPSARPQHAPQHSPQQERANDTDVLEYVAGEIPEYATPAYVAPLYAPPASTPRVRWPAILLTVLALALVVTLALVLAGVALRGFGKTSSVTTLYSKPMTSKLNDWPDDQECSFRGDGYHITAATNCYQSSATYSNATITVTAKLVSGDAAGAYGIAFRRPGPNKYYLFLVTGDGRWLVARDNVTVLQAQLNSAIKSGPGAINKLAVRMQGDHFTFFANGTQLGTLTDSTYASGNIGLAGDSNIDVAFKDFTVTQP